ncbi:MAG TPA: hypothetical protein PKD54_00050 [Pirellulaceae bacterium]|nr:hypothetical protein [Pirellulaceae bacterium]
MWSHLVAQDQVTDDRQTDTDAAAALDWPLLFETAFASEDDLKQWEFVGGEWSWAREAVELDSVEHGKLVLKKAPDRYTPPFRSPTQLALLKDVEVADFQLDVWVRSTHTPYGHRDVCFFFGYQASDRYYYAHLADETDERANQVFVVNLADREKISQETTAGTPWDDSIHHVRIQRTAGNGRIEVYFDDMSRPIMRAEDRSFSNGRVGVGSFDDSAEYIRIELRGVKRAVEDRQERPVPFAAFLNRAFFLGHRF